jgi:HlyD family secretion protein
MTDSVIRSLSQLQWTMDNAVLNVELNDLAIRNSSLYAPFAGIVTAVPTNTAGMQVIASDVFEIVDPQTIEFVGEVDEIDIGKLKEGQPVHVVLDAYIDETTDSVVEHISLKATTSTKSSGGTVFLVKAKLPSDYLRYRIGMNGTMKIVTNKVEDVLTIPLSSVVERDGKKIVQIKDGKKTIDREIEIGIENDDRVEVRSGLSETDEIVEIK